MSTIVVFGLSGVGKSHLINGLISKENSLVHVQASALLKAAKERETGSVVDAEHLRRDKVIDNQALLLEAFAAFRSAETRAIVFDGHNLIDTPGGIQEIPFEVVDGLAPSGIVLVVDDPAVIVRRRSADASRPRPRRTAEELGEHQDRAIHLARDYAGRLGVPFTQVLSGDRDAFARAVEGILRRPDL